MTELAEHDVEGAVSEGQALGVALVPLDVRLGRSRILPGALEQLRGEIESRDLRPATPSGDRYDSCAAPDVEDPLAGLDAGEGDEAGCRHGRRQLERGEGSPRLPLGSLELCQCVHVCPHACSDTVTSGMCPGQNSQLLSCVSLESLKDKTCCE